MITIEASVPCTNPPAWAFLERDLLSLMSRAVETFLAKYTDSDGRLIWLGTFGTTRDGVDDFYEPFFNWPLLYLLGGDEALLPQAHRQWEAITAQLTDLGMLKNEYDIGYDQFHQSEGNLFLYFLCLADPTNPVLIERATRFAGFYLNEDPQAHNYDADHQLVRAPHNGSGGPREGYFNREPIYGWYAGMAPYGLPYHDVPEVHSYEDLKDRALARRMGQAMQERMGRGDVAINLLATSLVTNAYLLTGDQRYRQWVVSYVDAWRARAQQNGGIVPDNVGLSGVVGEYLDGKWYGGLYGWTWPHGLYSIGPAVIVAATNALLLTGQRSYLDFPRTLLDHFIALGTERDLRELEMSLPHHWIGIVQAMDEAHPTFVVPFRYGDHGWFDWQPLPIEFPVALWQLSHAATDWQRLEQLRAASHYDWRRVVAFRNKGDSGHEAPWTRFLIGDNPAYPETILRETWGQVCRRLALIHQDHADLATIHIHHWQELNPVVTEALVQLTLGAPSVLYNGGLLQASVRYFDAQRVRPGLPRDTAALVESITEQGLRLRLLNLSPFEERTIIIQAGAFAEHQIVTAAYSILLSPYPGQVGSYAAPDVQIGQQTVQVEQPRLHVRFPPATEIVLDLALARFVYQPSYALPWEVNGQA